MTLKCINVIELIISMETTESVILEFNNDEYEKKIEEEYNGRSYVTDKHGCFNHKPGESYTGPKPKMIEVQNNNVTYETDSHGCFNHTPLHEYSGPIPNNSINPQDNYKTYTTNTIGNLIDENNMYSGPMLNQSEEAQKVLKEAAAHKLKVEKALDKYFKKKSKHFLKGWYTTIVKTSK